MKQTVWLAIAVALLLALGSAVASASDSADQKSLQFGKIVRPASGVYVLDRAIGFNVLDAAMFNPKTGQITLVGHRDSRYGNGQIPYLELLACLLQHSAPTFNLWPTHNSIAPLKKFFNGPAGGRIIEEFGQLFAGGRASGEVLRMLGLPASGAGPKQITAAVLKATGPLRNVPKPPAPLPDAMRRAMFAAWTNPDGMEIGPLALASTFGLRFDVRPEYIDLDPESRLARAMFEADYLGKHLTQSPRLQARIPGYATMFASRLFEDTERVHVANLWISIAKLNLARSADGLTLETRAVSMEYNLRSNRQAQSQVNSSGEPPGGENLSPYAQRLSRLYPELEKQFPVLHELSECAKLAAVARWIHVRKPQLKLPEAGLTRWRGPHTAPGVFYAILSIPRKSLTPTHYSLDANMIAAGGVSLDPFPGSSGLPNIRVDPAAGIGSGGISAPPPVPGAKGTPMAWVKDLPSPSGLSYQALSIVTGRGMFGEPLVEARFPKGSKPAPGTDTRALDQLKSAATSGGPATAAVLVEDAKGNARLAFDTSGVPGAVSVAASPVVKAGGAGRTGPASVWKNPEYQALVSRMKELDRHAGTIQTQIAKQEAVVKSAPPEDKSDEEVKLSELYQEKSDNEAQKNYVTVQSRESFHVDVNVTGSGKTAPVATASPSSAP